MLTLGLTFGLTPEETVNEWKKRMREWGGEGRYDDEGDCGNDLMDWGVLGVNPEGEMLIDEQALLGCSKMGRGFSGFKNPLREKLTE